MIHPQLSSEALDILHHASRRNGRIAISLTSPTSKRQNRPIMELIVAGLLEPVAVRWVRAAPEQQTAPEEIVYAVAGRVP